MLVNNDYDAAGGVYQDDGGAVYQVRHQHLSEAGVECVEAGLLVLVEHLLAAHKSSQFTPADTPCARLSN